MPKTTQHVQGRARAGTQVSLTRKSRGPHPLYSNDSQPLSVWGVGGETIVLLGDHSNLLLIAFLLT